MPTMKDLAPIVLTLVLVGIIIGIGVLIQSKTYVAFADTAAFNESLSVANVTATEFATTYIESVTFVGNGSVDCTNSSTFSTFGEITNYITVTDVVGCVDPDNCCGTLAGAWDIEGTYVDVANSEASEATSSVLSATKEIATSWLSLIITVLVLAIILGLIMTSFGRR